VGTKDFFDSLKQQALPIRISLMKNPNHMFISTLLALGFLALSPIAQAVEPVAADSALPGGNTGDGQLALASVTTGLYNSAFGIYSLLSLTDGNFCTGVGAGTLLSNTGNSNTASGAGALLSNTSGGDNTANGAFALFNNTASGNTAVGSNALLNNTTGGTLENIQGIDVGPNVAVGWQALESNTVAGANTAMGYQALHSFTTGPVGLEQLGLCTAVGFQALANATGGFGNSGFGYQTLHNNTDGVLNTAVGVAALAANTTGGNNVAIGANALPANTTGDNNTANGATALVSNTTGGDNTAIGAFALSDNATGSQNTAIGHLALTINTADFNTAIGDLALGSNTIGTSNTAVGTGALEFSNGSGNIALGVDAGNGVTTADAVICIGAAGANVTGSCYIGNIFGATSPGGMAVFVNSDGKLGTSVSSRRFKEEIKPMDKASEAILALQPVTFRYKKDFDPSGTAQFGLVAEEVEKVNPDLVVHDKDGKPYSVRYDQVNAMLLNEFLKEHRKVEEQDCRIQQQETAIAQQRKDFEVTITGLKKEMETIVARTKDQDAKIQKVSDQVEMGKPATKVVLNNP
jgi:hypothetical protein